MPERTCALILIIHTSVRAIAGYEYDGERGTSLVDVDNAQESLRRLGFHPQFVADGMEGFVFDIRLVAE